MSATLKTRVGRYINEVCELFDVTVLCDCEEVDEKIRTVVAIGWNSEPDAGIRYGTITNWFSSEQELDEFCERNIVRFREEAEKCNNGAPVPDATEWR